VRGGRNPTRRARARCERPSQTQGNQTPCWQALGSIGGGVHRLGLIGEDWSRPAKRADARGHALHAPGGESIIRPIPHDQGSGHELISRSCSRCTIEPRYVWAHWRSRSTAGRVCQRHTRRHRGGGNKVGPVFSEKAKTPGKHAVEVCEANGRALCTGGRFRPKIEGKQSVVDGVSPPGHGGPRQGLSGPGPSSREMNRRGG